MIHKLESFAFSKSEFEDQLDVVKAVVVCALVNDGLIDLKTGDDWTASHGLKLERKSLWRTISDRWKKEPDTDHYTLSVVSRRV